MKVKITERGWAGHFIGGHACKYHRNTLIAYGKKKIIVSSVGGYQPPNTDGEIDTIGLERFYETMVFWTKKDGCYIEIEVSRGIEIPDNLEWGIFGTTIKDLPEDVDNIMDKQHDEIVKWICNYIKRRNEYKKADRKFRIS